MTTRRLALLAARRGAAAARAAATAAPPTTALPSTLAVPRALARPLSTLTHRGFAAAALPPFTELAMPALSPTMTAGNIAAWKKAAGDAVAAGDVLADIETDKATMEWEAQDDGVIAKILVESGARDVHVGTPVAIVVDDAASVAAFADYEGGVAAAPAAAAPAAAAPPSSPSKTWPPHTVAGLPALSPTMTAGTIAAWKKAVGDPVSPGDALADVETDKATMEWENQDDGFIAALLVPAGARDVAVGSPVAVFVDDADLVAAFADFTAADAAGGGGEAVAAAPAAAAPAPASAPPTPTSPRATTPTGGRVPSTPYARKLAADAGVDFRAAAGTGPGGRVVAADVRALIAGGGGAATSTASSGPLPGDAYTPWTDIPHSNIRRVTAARLTESKQRVPHYYLTVDIRVDALLDARSRINATATAVGQDKLSVNDFVIKAAALALKAVPGVNAAWADDFTRVYSSIDICVAVQTPSGLMVPVLTDAATAGLADVGRRVKALAAKAKKGGLSPSEMSGGTFTVSNLGMYGVTAFSAIVNPPQAAILAVGGVRPALVPSDGATGFENATLMAVTLSCDHRVVDGALGAQWLQAFKRYMEEPLTMLL